MTKDVRSIIDKLKTMHGEPRCELNFTNPLELVVATILSAQCTDERVNKVTETLFKKYRNIYDYIDVINEELENDIRSTGFYKNKANAIKNITEEIRDRFHGEVPRDIDTLATVKWIGRKSANLIVGLTFDKPAVIVDAHVIRLSNRIGFSDKKDPDKIEQDIKKVVPEDMWTAFSMLITLHGRYMCKARKPECERCLLQNECDYWTGGGKNV